MNAKQCDRCGRYYNDIEKNKILLEESKKISKHALKGYNIDILAISVSDGRYCLDLDLCPCCIIDFIKWVEGDTNDKL